MKKRLRLIFALLGVAALIFIVFYISRFILPAKLTAGSFQTAVVDRGQVIKTVPAEGVVESENEVLLHSPASSVIERIINSPGSHVKKGEVILTIDQNPVREQIEKIEDQLEVKRNTLHKNRLNARSTRLDLDYNVEMKKLKIASIKTELADQEQLLDVGGISPAKFDQTKQELVFAQKELEMIQQKNSIRLKQLEADEEGLLLQIQIQEKELEDMKGVLQNMIVRAPSSGIVLNVYGKEGEKVDPGKIIVRMSDLSSFKISGSIDDKFAETVKTGREVFAIIDGERLPGQIGIVRPVVENNKINFDVFLKDNNHQKLLPNMKVDLMVVKQLADSALRISKGSAFSDNPVQDMFVVKGDKAIRREVHTGLIGMDYIEILSGLSEGEKVVTSDVSSIRHLKEAEIEH